MHAMSCVDGHEGDDGCEDQHERAESVDAEVVLDAQGRRPQVLLDEADAAVDRQAGPDVERHHQRGKGGDESDVARVLARPKRDGRPHQGQHGQQRQYG
jgi:hypothetical protein